MRHFPKKGGYGNAGPLTSHIPLAGGVMPSSLQRPVLLNEFRPPEGAHFQQTDRLIRLPELMVLTGMSRSAIYAAMDPRGKWFDPEFPARLALGGGRSVAWRLSSVLAWVQSRPARLAEVPCALKDGA